jgi:hypothetical protein
VSEKPRRTVRIRATVEYDLEVPADMSDRDIEFHRNEGTYCSDRLVTELQEQVATEGIAYDEEGYRPCMCGVTTFEVLDALTATGSETLGCITEIRC